MARYPQNLDEAARRAVGRLTPVQKHELAVAAMRLALADQHSLRDAAHHDHVHGVITALAPTLGQALRQAIAKARQSLVRKPVHQ